MPHSLVLNILPQSPIPSHYLTGRHLHALFLTLVSSVDKPLGDRLHESTADKAFTLSPLQMSKTNLPKTRGNKNANKLQYAYSDTIAAGTPCWWRISLLDDTLFHQLTQLWLNLNPQHPWHLGPSDLFITSIQGTVQSTQPWANATSYQTLYELSSDSDRTINFSFSTPTAFRQGKFDNTLPTRECVFNSLLSKWNKYSGMKFDEIEIDSIFPSYLNIYTDVFPDSRSIFIGVVGEVSYRILGEIEPDQIKQINTLANFALYTGVGRKTPMGMGMLRRLNYEIDL
jgi:CRISPR-associated endoribonuclease Cas6